MTDMPVNEDRHAALWAALEARKRGSGKPDGFKALCPVHPDKETSLSCTRESGDIIGVKCFAGCTSDDVLAALGFVWQDRYPAGHQFNGHDRTAAPPRPIPMAVPDPDAPPRHVHTDHTGTITEYTCLDVSGKEWTHVRTDRTCCPKTFRWDPPGPGSAQRHYVPRRLPDDLTIPVYVVEGEKAADALAAIRWHVVGLSGGKGSPPSEDTLRHLFAGRKVICWPDVGDKGYMAGIARMLDGIAASVRYVTPDATWPDGWDAADVAWPGRDAYALHLHASGKGHTTGDVDDAEERVVEAIRDRVDKPLPDEHEADPPTPKASTLASGPPAEPAYPAFEDRGLAVPSPRAGDAYVHELVLPGRILLVAAEEGAGKSYAISGEMAHRLAYAGGLFAQTWLVKQTVPVLVMSEMHEDDDFKREEVLLASLEHDRAAMVGRLFRLDIHTAAHGKAALTNEAFLRDLTDRIIATGIRVLIVDTVTAATDIESWGPALWDVYRRLRKMLDEVPDLAIVLVVHQNKGRVAHGESLGRVMGEWGRANDVTMLMFPEGTSLDRVRIEVRKRVVDQRRIVGTKRDGLIVEVSDATSVSSTKVPLEDVLNAIPEEGAFTTASELAKKFGVSVNTMKGYLRQLGPSKFTEFPGPNKTKRYFREAPTGVAEPDDEDPSPSGGVAQP